ncbi:MAG: hypothetical protein M1820_005624 [Bogoriella megaspora]|nr:MAG: hypothetical protein M1820_005624 [Bogoriella megaspora]
MSADTGTKLSDLLPIPDSTQPVTDPDKEEWSPTLADKPTASHALALEEQEEKGAAQQYHDDEVVDLGWKAPKEEVPSPLVNRLPNEELWVLIRRFNKQLYHVKEYRQPVLGNLDLQIADDEEFSPDKLRSNVERLYMTVIIGLMAFFKQIVRLRSWKETRRTSWFCVVYFSAWIFDFLMPVFVILLLTLILYPPSRAILFPPAPIALVDAKSGGIQKPKAGVLGSHDSATGAPENHKGEAVEQEASNFVNSVATVALSSATGKHPQNDPPSTDESSVQDVVPDPTTVAVSAASARNKTDGGKPGAEHDKTKVPMETAMWTKMRPIMHGIADVSDTWERFANALSPTPPFPRYTGRVRLAAVIVPVLGVAMVVTSYMLMKGVTFGVGFGFFGDPIIQPALHWLNTNFPNWQKLLELRNTLLKGIPTNAQLTITLLRTGEANKAPLPPPPRSSEPPPEQPAEINDAHLQATGADIPLNASPEEIQKAVEPDLSVAHEVGGDDIQNSKDTKHGKKGSKVLGFFKSTTKATVEAALGADRLKATTGSEHAKNRLGVIPNPRENFVSGPIDFKCRYKGKKGWAYISTKATIPCVSFTVDHSVEKIGTKDREDLHPVWSVPVGDIRELKKMGGFGWKAKLVIGWALDREVADGLEIIDRKGQIWTITACQLRDELFNRLVAIGGQKWEAW